MQHIGLTQDILVNIEGREQTVTLAIEYHPNLKHYYLDAVTETGFDLCNSSYGYLKGYQNRNGRLRTDLSILDEMFNILEAYTTSIRNMAADIILTSRTTKATISGTDVYTKIAGMPITSAANIHSKQSSEVLSWYEHNVYKQGDIEVEVYRTKEGQLRLRADENALYDMDKLRALYHSEAFQMSKLAFFCYNECRRILGIPVMGDPKRMSGLFQIGVQE